MLRVALQSGAAHQASSRAERRTTVSPRRGRAVTAASAVRAVTRAVASDNAHRSASDPTAAGRLTIVAGSVYATILLVVWGTYNLYSGMSGETLFVYESMTR